MPDISKKHRELVRIAADHLVSFQAGFVRLIGNEDDATVAGSGTLVRISGGRPAILTAAHVIDALPKEGQIGIMLGASRNPQPERFLVEADKLQMLTIGAASHTADGPDLAVVVLPEAMTSQVTARGKAFYNLETRRSKMLTPSLQPELGFWGLCGNVHAWSADASPEATYVRVKAFRNIFGVGEVSNRLMRGPFDYLTFETRVGRTYEGPDNFEGVSGGGIWRVILKETEGRPEIAEYLLCGVAFYQTSVPGGIDLSCHGPTSIYMHAFAGERIG